MNTYFFIFSGLLIVAALVLLLPALWQQRTVAPSDADQRNLAIARQRLAELNEQLQAGVLSQIDYDAQRSELELTLADDLSATVPQAATAQGKWLGYVLLVLIPVLAVGLYAVLGNFQAIEPTPQMLATTPKPADIEKMVGQLAERLKQQPDNAEGWVMLGKSYKYLQRFPEAAEAFAKAYALLGEQPDIMLLYADALGITHNGQLAGQPAELIDAVLAKEPEHIGALWLGGMAKAQVGDSEGAKRLWQKLAVLLPPGSPDQQQIQEVLAKLDGANGPVAQTKAVISVQVSLDEQWQNQVKPSDTVFIYAQALSGPKMPLAIIRKQVAELPVTVSLTDAQAMSPAFKLSQFPTVRLLAKVSKSGNASTQSGDLLGTLESVAVTDKAVKSLVINQQIP